MANIKALVRIYKRVFFILTPTQRKRAFPVFLSMLVCSCLDLLGVSVIFPLLTLMMESADYSNNQFIKIIYSVWKGISFQKAIALMCVFIMIVFLVKNAVALVCVYMQTQYAARCKREIQTQMFSAYLRRPYSFFVSTNTGEIIRGVNGDTMAVYQILMDGFDIMTGGLSIILIGIYLFTIDWKIALVSLVLASCCFFGIVLGFKGKMKRAGKEYLEITGRQFQYCSQAINGIKEIIVMNRRRFFVDQYEKNAQDVQRITVTSTFIGSCPDRILEGVFVAGFMGVLGIAAIKVDVQMLIPIIGSFAMGVIKILPAVSKISNRVNDIIYEQKGLENCYNNITEARRTDEEQIDVTDSVKIEAPTFWNNFTLRDISWTYPKGQKRIFEQLSLSIKKGESIAFIGSSGAGKTTLADIILGIYHPQEGQLFLDKIDVSIIKNWNKIVGYVPQMTFLLDDTVRRNVAFGIEDNQISDDRIWEVLRKAQLEAFVRDLPKGLETRVGDRGIRFSGGQRQRLAIARVLYDNPEILVLDEATSALDSETENAVMDAINALQGYKTLIIVAHRLTTVRNCDRIFEIGSGTAIEVSKDKLFI